MYNLSCRKIKNEREVFEMMNEKQILIVSGVKMEFPLKVEGRYIHIYDAGEPNPSFCIGSDNNECFTDHEECDYFGLDKEKYQEILKSFGAKQFHHEFDYGNGDILPVQDSYFENLEKAIESINCLNNL